MSERKLLYIAGYSRSGSTILDIVLGSHPNIVSTGELAYLFDDWLRQERKCTCTNSFDTCEFWSGYQLPEGIGFTEAIDVIRRVEGRASLPKLMTDALPAELIENYRSIQTSLYDYIFTTSHKNIIIDSSKSSRDMAGRFLALQKYAGLDVYVVHLIKDGLSVVESFVTKGRNWAIEGYAKNNRFIGARSSMGWFLANSIARRLGVQLPAHHFLQIKYEDFVSQPELVLQTIGDFIQEDMSVLINNIETGKAFHPMHNVGGNRLRLDKEIRLRKSSGNKAVHLSPLHRFVFNVIAGKLHKQLGYSS